MVKRIQLVQMGNMLDVEMDVMFAIQLDILLNTIHTNLEIIKQKTLKTQQILHGLPK